MEALPKLGAVHALDHIEREGEAFLAQVAAHRTRGHHRQDGRCAVPRRPHRRLDQDQSGEHGRLRDRRIHGAEGKPELHRRAAARRHGGWHARVRRPRRHRLQRRICSPSSNDCSSRSCAPIRRAGRRSARARRRFPRRRRRRGSIRCTSAKCGFANGRRTVCCGMRRSCGCGPTRIRATASDRACGPSRRSARRRRAGGRTEPVVAPRRAADRAESREDDRLLESEENLLAGGRLHEGRSRRLLSRDLAVDVAVSHQSPARDDALSRRHRREVVLSEGRAGIRAGVDSHVPDLERGHAARHQLLRLRRRRVAALRRQPRLDSDAHLEQPRRIARAARLVRDRSRSEGGAVLRRHSHGDRVSARSARRSDCRAT